MHWITILIATAAVGMAQASGSRPTDPIQTPKGSVTPHEPKTTKEYAAGVIKGRAEADKQLAADVAKYRTVGLSVSTDYIERKTGLYFAGFGCVVDDEIEGRVEGYNARVAESIRDHGPPKNSFKPWEKELFELAGYFETRSRVEKPIKLNIGGPGVESPDGKYVVALGKRPGKNFAGEAVESISILVSGPGGKLKETFWGLTDADLIWGPKGSWFAVLRGQSRFLKGDRVGCVAFDLREVRTIREEFPGD